MNKFYNFVDGKDICDIYLYGDVGAWDEVNSYDFRENLSKIDDNKPINIHISSYGGEVNEGLAIGSLIKQHKGKTTAIIDSWACSIASIIACSCDEIEMYSSSMLMIHYALCMAIGNAKELREQADILDKVTESLKTVYLSKANESLTLEKLTELMDNESWLSANECIEYGLCDRIIETPSSMVAKLDKGILNKYKNVPSQVKALIDEQDAKQKRIEIENKIKLLDLELALL